MSESSLITVLENLYDMNVRHLNYNLPVSNRLLNTNDYIVNALITVLSTRHEIAFSQLNSAMPVLFSSSAPNLIPPINPHISVDFDSSFDLLFHEPVPVFPSVLQILEGTNNIQFSDIQNPISESCPISLNPFHPHEIVTQIRGCGHIFSREPIDTWFRGHCRCPICRFDIRTNIASNTPYLEEEEEKNDQFIRGYERTLSENATSIFNLLSDRNENSNGVVRDISGNDFLIRWRRT
jgi:hypothetical protein